ncbi:unnamed protein product, partial [Musa textilis]
YENLGRLKEILSSSQVIRNMIEQWLVEAGLNPASRVMVNFRMVRGMSRASSIPTSRPTAE